MNLPLQLDRRAVKPLQDQLFEQLRQLIIDGKLRPNTRVIATRFLADQAGVSRTTVLLAYERLISEGYLETRPAIGTYVAALLPDQPRREANHVALADIPRQSSIRPALRFTGEHAEAASELLGGGFDFSPAHSDASNLLPRKAWLKGVRDVFEREPDGLATASSPAGVIFLRRAIADNLAATRGIMAAPEQVIIVGGPVQTCNLVAHLFQRPGGRVVLEAPGNEQIVGLFRARRSEIVHVPVDEHGLITDQLPDGDASLVYLTPARHNPLGGTMPQPRRDALIAWARKAGAYVIEDDSDSELRYHGTTPQPLAATDPYGLVFHTGSFAKTLGAGLGLAYLVVPPEFVDPVIAIKAMAGTNCAWLEQMIVADLLISGEYQHHLRRVRKIYLERRDCLIQALHQHFDNVRLMGAEAGTQLTWLLPDELPNAEEICLTAAAQGVRLGSVPHQGAASALAVRYCDRALILGFAAIARDRLRDGIARLAKAIGA